MKTYNEFILEASRKPQIASKRGGKSKREPEDTRPKAYVTTGIPGSGKTTIVKHMQSQDPTIGHHELDKSRKALGKHPAYFGPDLIQHQNSGIEADAKKGNTVVVSNTAIPKAHRNASHSHLDNLGYDSKTVVLPSSPRAARRRNRNRTEGRVPDFVMSAMSRQRRGSNTNPRGGGAMSREDLRSGRKEFKKLHQKFRFTKPAMRRSGVIK